MKTPISSFQARWLLESDQPGISTPLALNGTPWQTYAFPNQQGTGGYEILELAMGMSVFRGEHRFNAQSFGRMIALAEFEVQFSEPTFMVQMARGGRIMHKEQIPLIDLVYSPGNDLFRYTQHIKQTPWLDASSDSDMFALSIGTSMLITLLGEDLAEKLITSLGLDGPQKVRVCPVPLHVSAPFLASLPPGLTGQLRHIYCQGKVLEYLSLLVNHMVMEKVQTPPDRRRKQAHAVHEYLVSLQGGMPSMDQIARMFNRPARALNIEFAQEYGASIYVFITAQRLEMAHAAILDSDIPLKRLAFNMGYSHVNNFNAAFTKKFGYGPGSLRKDRVANQSSLPTVSTGVIGSGTE